MKLRDLIEDATAGATASADIATVAYPLFVRGKTRREKRKNARAAVGQSMDSGKHLSYVGRGVFEGSNPADAVAMDVPLLIRALEHAREDIKSDADLHRFVERLLALGKRGEKTLNMADYSKLVAETLMQVEAHVLGNDSVIYRLDRENPMSDTEVAVIGGAGRYTLSALRDKARREADQLAQDLKVEHGGAFRRSAENIKQLTNTLNTIVAAYNELKRIRSKGGRGSRGITDEDANFIRECMGLVQRALKEGVAVEPDAHGYEKAKLTSPRYAVVVDTPSDYDWYKIGNHWHDRIIDPHEFGQEDSDTIMVASGEADFKDMLAKLDRMGFTYKLIGGTHSQPEIHKGKKA